MQTPVAFGIIHVSWRPVRYNSGRYPCKKKALVKADDKYYTP